MSATSFRAAFACLWRGHRTLLLVEVPLLIGLAALLVFCLSIPVKRNIDGLLFQVRANYNTVSVHDLDSPHSSGGIDALAVVALTVTGPPPRPETPSYFPTQAQVSLHVVQREDDAAYRQLVLGSNLASRGRHRSGVLIDADTAVALDLSVGSVLRVVVPPVGERAFRFVELPVAGIFAPAPGAFNAEDDGLVVADDATLPSWFLELISGGNLPGPASALRLAFDADPDRQTRSRAAVRDSFISALTGPQALAGYGALLATAFVIWLTVTLRAGGSLIRRQAARLALLRALGLRRPSAMMLTVFPFFMVMVTSASIAVVLVREFYVHVLKMSLQSPTALALAMAMGGLSAVTTACEVILLRRRLTHSAILGVLSREHDED